MNSAEPGRPHDDPADGTTLVRRSGPSGGRIAALDGWRGVAVAAVVAFHAGYLPGGWLGVDLFLVLSGFLITRLLLDEQHRTGRVALRGFWSRRARRLLPALVVVLAAIAAGAAIGGPATVPAHLAEEMVATVAYVANWYQLFETSGYWSQFSAPSPLEHMWSLAIEEQFYVLFPLLMIFLMRRRLRPRSVASVLALGALASWAWGAWLLAAGAGIERVYLGTDTRIGAVLLGAAAGAATLSRSLGAPVRRVARIGAGVSAIGLVVAMVLVAGDVAWPWWRWGILPLFELGVAAVLVRASERRAPVDLLGRVISIPPLIWLGTISYGLYLWHVPTLAAARRIWPDWPRPGVAAAGVGAAIVLSIASYRLVERPLRTVQRPRWWWLTVSAVGVVSVAASIVTVHRVTEPTRQVEAERPADGEVRSDLVPAEPDPTVPGPGEPTPAQLPLDRPEGRPARVLLLGDSMALDLSFGMQRVAGELGVQPSSSALIGCSVGGMDRFPGATTLGSDAAADACDAWLAEWGAYARAVAPDVVVVLRASARAAGPATAGTDQCSPEYLAWYREQVEAEVARLVPQTPVVALASTAYPRLGGVSDDTVDRSTDCRNGVLQAVAEEQAEVVYLPVAEWVCSSPEQCLGEVDGTELRLDGVHFQGPGADVASRWVVGELFG